MAGGAPLDDRDREPRLAAVGHWLRDHTAAGTGGIACSALERRYRDRLRAEAPDTYFLPLTADRGELLERIAGRSDHFMPPALLDSRLAALEPRQPGERGVVLHSSRDPEHVVDVALRWLRTTPLRTTPSDRYRSGRDSHRPCGDNGCGPVRP